MSNANYIKYCFVTSNSANQLIFNSSNTSDQSYNVNYTRLTNVTANSSSYNLISHTATIDSDWDIIPDGSSEFEFDTGIIYFYLTSQSNTTFYIYKYDVLTGLYYLLNTTQHITGISSYDVNALTVADSIYNIHMRSKAGDTQLAGGGQLYDGNYDFEINEFKDKYLFVFSGTNKGEFQKIASNTIDTITFTNNFSQTFDNTSYYEIWDNIVKCDNSSVSSGVCTINFTGANFSANQWKNMAVEIISGTGMGQKRAILKSGANSITLDYPFYTQLDSTSIILIKNDSDKIYVKAQVNTAPYMMMINAENFNFNMSAGRIHETGIIASGIVKKSADDVGIPISSTSYSGTDLTITTAHTHSFKTGDRVYISGDTGAFASTNNDPAGYICTATSFTTLRVTTNAGNMVLYTQTATSLKCAGKNWATNELANKTLSFAVLGTFPTTVYSYYKIISNTSDTITLAQSTTTTNINGARFIISVSPINNDYKACLGSNYEGFINTGGTLTTFTDSTKNWATNELARKYVVCMTYRGFACFLISSNTATTFTISSAQTLGNNIAYAIIEQSGTTGDRNSCRMFYFKWKNLDGIYMTQSSNYNHNYYDLRTDTVNYLPVNKAMLGLNSTSWYTYYCYDGEGYIYVQTGLTNAGIPNLYRINLENFNLEPYGTTPLPNSTSTVAGNYITVVHYYGYKYLIVSRASSDTSYGTCPVWRYLLLN